MRKLTTYPANQTRAHLTEEFQIKVSDAGIKLVSFEKVIHHIAWDRGRKKLNQTVLFLKQRAVKNGMNEEKSQHWAGSVYLGLVFAFTRVSPHCQVCLGSRARAHIQVDTEQGGDEEGSNSQLQEVAMDVGEINTLVHRCCYYHRAHHNGKETWRETKK